MLGSLLIPLMYFKSKKCRHHPSQIFFAISICQCLSCYNLLVWAWDTQEFISYFAIDQMFQGYVYKQNSLIKYALLKRFYIF